MTERDPITTFASPKDDTELEMLQIWAELLGVQQISTHDNFFNLGGHSLLAIQLMMKIREKFNVKSTISDIFDFPTIASLSSLTKQKFRYN